MAHVLIVDDNRQLALTLADYVESIAASDAIFDRKRLLTIPADKVLFGNRRCSRRQHLRTPRGAAYIN